jgi:ribosomal protein S18 acetylase RimI-like enzyme
MIQNGIYQWNDSYPSKEAFEKDVTRKELYVLEDHNKILGCISISTLMDHEYESVKWLTPSANNIYIHRLAVHPDFQGKGYARQLMDFAEERARRHHFVSIRLDTFSKNEGNQRFYANRGYHKLGSILFPNQSEHPFYCYELIL